MPVAKQYIEQGTGTAQATDTIESDKRFGKHNNGSCQTTRRLRTDRRHAVELV